jgi:hypothetical protein
MFQRLRDHIRTCWEEAGKEARAAADPFNDAAFQLTEDIAAAIATALKGAKIDVKARKVLWANGKQRSIWVSAQQLHRMYPQYPLAYLEEDLIAWIEGYDPPKMSEDKVEEFEEMLMDWIDDYEQQKERREKKNELRTRHS